MRWHLILLAVLLMSFTAGCTVTENVEIIEEMPEVVRIDNTPYFQMILEEMLAEKEAFNKSRPRPEIRIESSPIFDEIRPLAVMIDNQLDARPQSGLDRSKVVYEILAEGSITRYMMLVEPAEDFLIGPVRSARPYFVAYAMEYDALYAHAGGSVDGLDLIAELGTDNLNGLKAGTDVFWRESHRKMPHNLYTSISALKKDIRRLGYSLDPVETGSVSQYNRFVSSDGGRSASEFTLVYKPAGGSDPIGYSVSYQYDEQSRMYLRSVNHQAQLDEASGKRIDAGGVIVMQADHKVLDSAGRRAINITGSGEGVYLTMGQALPITWEKSSLTAPTVYRYSDGEEVIVNPGRLFIQVVEKLSQLTIKGE